MLFVAGLLLAPPQMVNKVVLIYHEQEILAAEQPHIAIMQKHFGDKVSAITYSHFQSKVICLEAGTLTITDEADSALIDKQIKLDGKGLFLGLTATGLSHASEAEKYYLANKISLVNISAGVPTDIDREVTRAKDINSFFSTNDAMAKLIYMGEKTQWFSKSLD